MIYETRINLRNKTKEELILFVNEGLETIKKYQAELERKDKVINEMAEYIASLDIDEDICKNIECGEEYEEINKCVECVIKFFEKRIK